MSDNPNNVDKSAINVESTNFEFDIGANRRRRAEIANDVTELLNISKFFLQHYSSDNAEETWTKLTSSDLKPPQNAKNAQNNAQKQRPKQKRPATGYSKRQTVAIVTPTCDTCKQTLENSVNGTHTHDNNKALPPLDDQNKLHAYCVDAVEEFFERAMSSGRSVPGKSGRHISYSGDKLMQRMKQVNNQNNTVNILKNPRYAAISPRYLSTPQLKRTIAANEQRHRLFPPNSLVTARSRQILANIVRKGIAIKKHSCLASKDDGKAASPRLTAPQNNKKKNVVIRAPSAERPSKPFSEMHPNIELVASNSIFPKRVLKQSTSSTIQNGGQTVTLTTSTEFFTDDVENARINGQEKTTNALTDREFVENPPILTDSHGRNDGSLQLRQLPSLSIEPRAQCKVENVFAIEIKADGKRPTSPDGRFLRKNEFHEFVYDSEPISEDKTKDTGLHQQPSNEVPAGHETRKLSAVEEANAPDELSMGEHSFNVDSHDECRCQNTSSVSLLTDDEKSRTDLKLLRSPGNQTDFTTTENSQITIDTSNRPKNSAESPRTRENSIDSPKRPIQDMEDLKTLKDPARTVIADILESEELTRPDESSLDNLEDLREILDRIRNDRTTMDIELQKQQQRIGNVEMPTTLAIQPTIDELSLESSRQMQDQSIQCDNLSSRAHATNNEHTPNSKQIPSQFTQYHESHCSSFRGSSIASAEINIYRGATRKQVQRAAKSFLRTMLEDADSADASKDECEDSSCINLKIERQKYFIVEDRLMRSRMNVMTGNETEESTSNEMPSFDWNVTSHPGDKHLNGDGDKSQPGNGQFSGNQYWTNENYSKNWNGGSYSDTDASTDTSVNISFGRRTMAYQDRISMSVNQRRTQQHQQKYYATQPEKPQSYMSEGEILSDGEARFSG